MHIHESAVIGENTNYGYNFVVEENVKIGANCVIGHNVVIKKNTTLGDNLRIDDNTVIGKMPMSSPRSIFAAAKELQGAVLADDCLIGANVVIYAGCFLGKKNLVADLATIRENVSVGDYNIIGRGVSIENCVSIGDRNKFETNCYITAYSKIGSYCFVAPGVVTSNDNYMARDAERFKHFKGITMEDGARLGANATVLPGRVIATDGTAAAGSVVTKNIPQGRIWAGNPAKDFREVPFAQLLESNKDKK